MSGYVSANCHAQDYKRKAETFNARHYRKPGETAGGTVLVAVQCR